MTGSRAILSVGDEMGGRVKTAASHRDLDTMHSLLFFDAGGQQFATPAVDVLRALAAEPTAGVELPGRVVALGVQVGGEIVPPDSERRILVLRGEEGRGVLVDAVRDIAPVPTRTLRRLPPWFAGGGSPPWVWGAILGPSGTPTLVLDLHRLGP